MKKIYLIGIGPGDPNYLTLQAINTLKQVNVFFLLEKAGRGKAALLEVRTALLAQFLTPNSYRVVVGRSPERNKNGPNYQQDVERWRQEKTEIVAALIDTEMADDEVGAFLIWGDPALYDGSLDILQDILRQGKLIFDYAIIPGITAVQVLAEKHKIALNRIGETITITSGRRLDEVDPAQVNNTVVMLDYHSAFHRFATDKSMHIYWGGALAAADEVLISGRVGEVLEDLDRAKTDAKATKGWLMDTYLLRRDNN